MIVVCDTSPICYLLLIDQIEVLPQLFGRVIIPQAVRDELLAEGSAAVIQSWISQPPAWLEIRSIAIMLTELPEKLGAGEREAISLFSKSGCSPDRTRRLRCQTSIILP